MKCLVIILFPFILLAQTWYVDRDATGAANGTSWTDAWTNFSETAGGIDWSEIGSGDTIYISGGADSTTYCEITNSNRVAFYASSPVTFSPPVIIRPSWEAGHNGEVHFSSQYPEQDYILLSEKIHGVRFEDLNFTQRTGESMGFGAFYGNDITVYSSTFMMGDGGAGLKIDGDRWMFDGCLFERTENELRLDTDMIGQNTDTTVSNPSSTGRGVIKNCVLIYRNGYTFDECSGIGNITITDTSLVDAGLSMTVDYHVGASVNVWHGDTLKYIEITSNTATTFYGTGWYASEVSCPPPAVACYQMEGSHRDGMQFGDTGWERYIADSTTYIVVANNLIINDNPRGSGWNKMVYSYSPYIPYDFYLYNNIIVNRNAYSGYRNIGIETPNAVPFNGWVNCTGAANVTITDTSVTDSEIYLRPNRYADIGTYLRVYDGGYKYLYVTSNNDSTLFGSHGWTDVDSVSATTPPNGTSFTMVGGRYNWSNPAGQPDDRVSNKWSLHMFNNTIITKGTGNNMLLTSYNSDSSFVKNNLFVMDSVMLDGLYNLDGGDGFPLSHKEFDYNYYAFDDSIPALFGFDMYTKTLAQWQALDRDTTSFFHLNTDVTFTEKYGLDVADYYTTAGRDSAVDLSAYDLRLPPGAPPASKDILGNDRDANWDVGALEFSGSSSPVNGGWLRGSSGKKIYDKNGRVIITR